MSRIATDFPSYISKSLDCTVKISVILEHPKPSWDSIGSVLVEFISDPSIPGTSFRASTTFLGYP